jgi:hypothetical protein
LALFVEFIVASAKIACYLMVFGVGINILVIMVGYRGITRKSMALIVTVGNLINNSKNQ